MNFILQNMNTMKRIHLLGLFVLLGCLLNPAIGQKGNKKEQIQITSTVTNAKGLPIQGAEVYGNEGAVYTTTDSLGNFALGVNNNSILVVEADGYETQVLSSNVLLLGSAIVLEPSAESYKRDVNVAFGTLSNNRIVGSVFNTKAADVLTYDARGSIQSALTGYAPGVFDAANIWGMGGALLVVDGLPRSNTFSFNLEEVDEITVLKDVTSKMLYGTTADQGVILITTKRGQANKRVVNVTGEYGIATPLALPEYVSSADYVKLYNQARINDGLNPKYSDDDLNGFANGSSLKYNDEDYYSSEYLKRKYSTARINTEFSGGNDIAQYYLNMGWSGSGGYQKMGDDERENYNGLNVRANVNCKLNDFIKLQVDGLYYVSLSHGPVGDYWKNASTLRPDRYPQLIPADSVKAMLVDDQVFSAEDFRKQALYVDGNNVLGGTSQYNSNIYGDQKVAGYYDAQQRNVQITTGFEFDLNKFVKGLTLNTLYSFDAYNQHRIAQNNSYAVYEPIWYTAPDGSDSMVVKRHGSDDFTGKQAASNVSFTRYHSFFGVLNYDRKMGIHAIAAAVTGIGQFYNYEGKVHAGKHLDFGARVNYMLLNKYVVELGASLVGSPLLADGKRWGMSPAIAAGWILSEEEFLKSSTLVNYLKLRAGYGILNTDRGFGDTYYSYTDTYNYGGTFTYNDNASKNKSIRANFVDSPDLVFEKRKELSIGFESMLLKNRIWIEAGYFSSLYDNIFTDPSATYPSYLGTRPRINYDSKLTTGFEGGISLNQTMGDFGFRLGSNVVYSKPKNIQIDEQNFEATERLTEGKESDGIYGYVFDRFYTEDDFNENGELIDGLAPPAFGTVKPGDLKYVDIYEDGIIDENDQKLIGNSNARLQYSIHLNLQYKGFELFVMGTGKTGGEASLRNDNYYHVYGEERYSVNALDSWTSENAASAKYPRLSTTESSNNHLQSTFWLYSKDRFDIHTLQLTYNFSKTNNPYVKRTQCYVRASNLLTISESKDILTLNVGSSPQSRYFAVGIKMNL